MAREVVLEVMAQGLQLRLGPVDVEAYWGEMLQAAPTSSWRREPPVSPKQHRWMQPGPAPGKWEEEKP